MPEFKQPYLLNPVRYSVQIFMISQNYYFLLNDRRMNVEMIHVQKCTFQIRPITLCHLFSCHNTIYGNASVTKAHCKINRTLMFFLTISLAPFSKLYRSSGHKASRQIRLSSSSYSGITDIESRIVHQCVRSGTVPTVYHAWCYDRYY